MKLLIILLAFVPIASLAQSNSGSSIYMQGPSTDIYSDSIFRLAAKDPQVKACHDSAAFYQEKIRKSHSPLDAWPVRFWKTKEAMRYERVVDSIAKKKKT